MEALNSLLFVLSTLAPNTNPPDNYPIPYTAAPEWDNNISPTEKLGEYDIRPCFKNIPTMGDMNCPLNEHYERCGPVCPESCFKYDCPLNCCVEGCVCDDGYVRGVNGSCVRRHECFANDPNKSKDYLSHYRKECGPDEYIGCDSECQRDCNNYKEDFTSCSNTCVLDCVCVPPKIRGPDGTCIHPRQCRANSMTRLGSYMKDMRMYCNILRTMGWDPRRCLEILKGCDDHPYECYITDEGYLQIISQENFEPKGKDLKDFMTICKIMRFMGREFPRCVEKFKECENHPDECYDSDDSDVFHLLLSPQDNFGPKGKDLKDLMMICQFARFFGREFPKCAEKFKECENHPDECYHSDESDDIDYLFELLLSPQNNFESKANDERQPCFPGLKPRGYRECPAGEHYEQCGPVCQKFCIDPNDSEECRQTCCMEGCFCDEGHARGPDLSCIPEEECPMESPLSSSHQDKASDESQPCFPRLKPRGYRECPAGEHYEQCGPVCQAFCSDPNESDECRLTCCLEGCFCDEGHVRGPDLTCIPEEQCPMESPLSSSHQDRDSYISARKSCGPDESRRCDSHCQRNCSNYYDSIPCPKICVIGCVCNPPMIRGPDGDCIFPEQCPTRPLEGLESDMNKLAIIRNFLHIRESTSVWSNTPSIKGKQCKSPFGCSSSSEKNAPRSFQGQFFKCRRENEFLNPCKSTCPDTCYDYQDKSRACKKICLPIPQCDCKDGYVRGPTGDCITPEECPNNAKTPGDCTDLEYYDSCGPTCEDDCDSYMDMDKNCTDNSCKVGCFCKQGFVRGPNGQCISPTQCVTPPPEDVLAKFEKSVCPENEEWQFCGTACPKDCSNYDIKINCIAMCSTGCFCKEPMVRGPDGKCILIEECPPRWRSDKLSRIVSANPVCPENEYYDECNADCQKNCTNFDRKVSCSSRCVGGCVCKPPMVRGPDCVCVNVEECTETVKEEMMAKAYSDVNSFCPENEYYDDCGSSCPKNCTNYNKDFFCPSVCVPGCFCKPPLIRGPSGQCLAVEECPDTPSGQKDRKYKIDLMKVVRQFPSIQCNKNERFTACKSICPDTCTNHNEDRFCKFICVPGCACLPGYVISREGDCIKKEHCVEDRPEDCNELEVYNDCGSYCETDCFNFNMSTRKCHIKECRKGCYCKPGWIRSPDMKCIRPYECPRRPTQHGSEWLF